MLDEDEALVRSVFGDKIQPLSLTVGDRQYHGWERQVTRQEPLPILFGEIKNFRTEQETLVDLVEQSWRSFHQRNIRLWSSFGWNVCAVPQMPTLGILEYAGVGIHNQSDEAMRKTHEAVTLIYSQCPFEILFADPAGLVAAFLEPVSEQQAWEFEDLIYSVAWESCCALPEAYQDQVDEQGIPQIPSMTDYILDEQRFRLWWDS